MTTVDSWPKTLPMLSVGSWNVTTETHLVFSLKVTRIYLALFTTNLVRFWIILKYCYVIQFHDNKIWFPTSKQKSNLLTFYFYFFSIMALFLLELFHSYLKSNKKNYKENGTKLQFCQKIPWWYAARKLNGFSLNLLGTNHSKLQKCDLMTLAA